MINGETSLLQILVKARHLLTFISLSISGDSFLGSGYFHNIIQMSVRQVIANFRFINIIIINNNVVVKYVIPNIQSISPANTMSIGYCGVKD